MTSVINHASPWGLPAEASRGRPILLSSAAGLRLCRRPYADGRRQGEPATVTSRTIPTMGVEAPDAAASRAKLLHTKVGVVGVGAVGAATALALIERGVFRELVL